MKIAVIGAGIVGITTAYELALDGHEVTVFERRLAAAEETSFANGGIMAPGYTAPWAAPGMPGKIARHLFSQHAPVRFSWPLKFHEMGWMWKCLRACKAETYALNRTRMQQLAHYSQQRLNLISAELRLDYDHSQGYLVLLRSEKELALMQPNLQVLRDAAYPFKQLTPEEARKVEPALNPDTTFHGAIHLPQDGAGNCRQVALLLKNELQRMGAELAFSTTVEKIDANNGMAVWLAGETAPRAFDQVVVCAGVESARLLQPLGLKIPLAAIHGYSVSATVREALNAPRSAVMDERYKIAIARLGNRVRVAGSAEIGGRPGRQRDDAVRTLYKVLHDWFPGAAQLSHGIQVWKGSRPMLPDGPPLLGASGVPGLWLNLGHGSSGWTLGCGSARALADLIGGKVPEIDLTGLGVERLRT